MWSRAVAPVAFVALLSVLAPGPVGANPASVALRARGSNQIYNLDRDEAISTFREAIAADPQDAGAYRGLATAVWLSITFRRGNMTVDEYLGRVTKPNDQATPAPPEAVAAFREALDKAIAIARTRLDRNRRDADGHYQLGAAVGLRASYTATVEGRVGGAFRDAREAFTEHEQVLALDPTRKDAGLIVGTYRYLVSTLSLPMRWMAYVVGFAGDKERGLRLIRDAAQYQGDNQEDARAALVLLYNRERRYDEAITELQLLRERFPRNRLLWLETASTELRAGRPANAERLLNDGMSRFADDRRARMFGEDALWRYKRGAARAALGRAAEAEADLRLAIQIEGRRWVHGRSHLELGKLALKAGDRTRANEDLQAAVKLCEGDNDPEFAEEARRLLR
ncbi:MAG TPA: tetratricopeptide repeat protein [Vicinamibacterales bacterium]|jgi:tetratricopeptide (TPR) repeat protein|nr:tetratricopeptide repeat protein [Vicinamibacterales bacterium]